MVQDQKVVTKQERVDQVAHLKAKVRVVVERISKRVSMIKTSERVGIMEKIKTINNRIP